MKVKFAFQELSNLPDGFECPPDRQKPWGTGHAILSAADLIQEPFVVINGDDFYGLESYQIVSAYYKNEGDMFTMVAYELGNTLSEFGGVTRGLCTLKNDFLSTVIETNNLKRTESGVSSERNIPLDGSEPVSMNVWGFTPDLFPYLKSMFNDFLKLEGKELKSEFFIPSVVNNLIQSNIKAVKVLKTGSSWFGVTYKEDKPHVVNKINSLVDNHEYPLKLF